MSVEPFVVPFWSPAEVAASINGTIAHLAAGRVLAYPTETVYGFGGAIDHDSVEALVQHEGAPAGQALSPPRRRRATW